MSGPLKMSLSDSAQKFILEKSNVRGVIVHLTQSFKTMLAKHDYPPAVQRHLGELLLAAALLAETIKLNGRMTIQFQSDSSIKLLVAQINDEGHLRGLAQWDVNASESELEKGLGQGNLVVTIFLKNHTQPMQSIVTLAGKNSADALAYYFMQSEQLPTHFRFAVKDDYAAGYLLQVMPEHSDPERETMWETLTQKVNDIDTRELFYDNNAAFLQFHFPDENIRLFDSRDLVFECGCSIEKMKNAIAVIGAVEANLIIKEKSEIVVTCEYCNHHYAFDKKAVEDIFR